MNFFNSATADTATFTNGPGRTGADIPVTETIPGFGAQTNFYDSSTAAGATFNNLGQTAGPTTGDNKTTGGTGGLTTFHDTSTAAGGTFNNFGATHAKGLGGSTQFTDSSTAASANIFNNGGVSSQAPTYGMTLFTDNATAANAVIFNRGGAQTFDLGGRTVFAGSAQGGSALIVNQRPPAGVFADVGSTHFYDHATAEGATIHNGPGGGTTEFHELSTAGSATIINRTDLSVYFIGGTITFRDASSAGSAHVSNQYLGGVIEFGDDSTAASAHLTLEDSQGNSALYFRQRATAASSTISIGAGAQVKFENFSKAGASHITVHGSSPNYGYSGYLFFQGDTPPDNSPGVSAENATIVVESGPGYGYAGGYLAFNNPGTTAGNATITALGADFQYATAGYVTFNSGASAGSATVFALGSASGFQGASINFGGGAHAENARVVATGNAVVDFHANKVYGGTPVGALEGSGFFVLDDSLVTVGSLGTSTVISGTISDYHPSLSGRLTKVGAGTLTLSGNNTYNGLTTVEAGTLAVNGSIAGPVVVRAGATLKGTGSTGPASVDPGGVIAPGNSPGTLHTGPLSLAEGAILDFEVGPASDMIDVTGDLVLDGILNITAAPGFALELATLNLIHYTGTLTDHHLRLGTLPPGYSPSQFAISAAPGGLLQFFASIPGDANLDGRLGADDFALLDRGFAAHLAGRSNGDFNLDGAIDAADYLILDTSYLQRGGGGAPELLATREARFGADYVASLLSGVPEPSGVLTSAVALGLARRRRRGRSDDRAGAELTESPPVRDECPAPCAYGFPGR